jgi:PASTA domain
MVDAGGEIKVPGLGDVQKKYVIGGVVVGGLIAVIVYIRIRNTAATTATAAATPVADPSIDPATDLPYAEESGTIDPSTDLPYAEESGGGNYGGGGAYGNTNLDAQGYPIGSAQDLQWQLQQSTGVTTNEEWVNAAMGDLPGDQATIQAALLGVLSGQSVTTAQKSLFLEAVALNGQPPQGYPTPIKLTDTAAQPGTPAPSKVKVPKVTGEPGGEAFNVLEAAGLKPVFSSAVKPDWIITGQTPSAGSSVSPGSRVTITGHAPTPVKR